MKASRNTVRGWDYVRIAEIFMDYLWTEVIKSHIEA